MPIEAGNMSLSLVILSGCLLESVFGRGVAMVGGGGRVYGDYTTPRTFGESESWYWFNRFGSILVAGGILATLVTSVCCVCCCLQYKRTKKEKEKRRRELFSLSSSSCSDSLLLFSF